MRMFKEKFTLQTLRKGNGWDKKFSGKHCCFETKVRRSFSL